jgi:hypothetical protein
MAVALARVPAHVRVPWTILTFVLKVESSDLNPQLEDLIRQFQRLKDDLVPVRDQLEELERKGVPLLEEVLTFQANIVPVWDDTYNLCGRASCAGNCAVCLDGEYLGEVDEGEKYCRRRR